METYFVKLHVGTKSKSLDLDYTYIIPHKSDSLNEPDLESKKDYIYPTYSGKWGVGFDRAAALIEYVLPTETGKKVAGTLRTVRPLKSSEGIPLTGIFTDYKTRIPNLRDTQYRVRYLDEQDNPSKCYAVVDVDVVRNRAADIQKKVPEIHALFSRIDWRQPSRHSTQEQIQQSEQEIIEFKQQITSLIGNNEKIANFCTIDIDPDATNSEYDFAKLGQAVCYFIAGCLNWDDKSKEKNLHNDIINWLRIIYRQQVQNTKKKIEEIKKEEQLDRKEQYLKGMDEYKSHINR
jgi:hypothetical protein